MSEKGGIVEIPLERVAATGPLHEITVSQVKTIGDSLGIDWNSTAMTELFEGTKHEASDHVDVLGTDVEKAVRIAYTHVKEIPDYYTRLKAMEEQAEKKEPNTDNNIQNASAGTER